MKLWRREVECAIGVPPHREGLGEFFNFSFKR